MAEHWICLGEHSRASAKMLLGAYADGFEIGTTPGLKPQQPHKFKMKFVELDIDDGLDGSGRPKPKMANLQIPPDMSHVSDMDSKESHKSQEMAQYSDIQLD